MKKTIPTIVMAMLCLSFSVRAQENKAIDVTSKGIQIGQKVPITSALEKYEGKLIILDFWATWCSPCVAMIPKMEALQAQFKDEIQILPVTYQTEKEVLPFLTKLQKGKPSILPQITGDKELHKLFPHVYLPHYVWIDYTGTVRAITGHQEITEKNIEKILSKSDADLGFQQKKDMKMAFDKTKPFLINGNGGDGSNMIYHSVLTRFIEGIPSGYIKKKDSNSFSITIRNQSLPDLFKLAMGEGKQYFTKSKIKLEVADVNSLVSKSRGEEYLEWLRHNAFCYEVIVPLKQEKDAYTIMQRDLTTFITNYTAVVEKRSTECLLLVRTTDHPIFASKGGKSEVQISPDHCLLKNAGLAHLISRLQVLYLQNSPLPIVDDTGYKGLVDLELNANLSDVTAMNKELEKYGLKFITKEFPVNMLIIKQKAE